MYRVVTKYRNGSSRPVVERGPWHTSKKVADDWADALRNHGYVAFVEAQNRGMDEAGASSNNDLANALASMA